jgi:cytochrome c oxidase assembly protein subunit 15
VHGYIEFGNRMLTFALSAIILALALVTWRLRRERPVLFRLALLGLAGIAGQALLGGITVLTGLNPWSVSAHLLVSLGLIFGAYALWHRAREGDGARVFTAPRAVRGLVRATLVAAGATLALGTIVTGSGPHSGDTAASRTGFDPETVSQLHGDAVFALVGLTLALVLVTALSEREMGQARLRRGAYALLGLELAQGAVGFTQYALGLPTGLVALHLLGACLVWLAALRLLFLARIRPQTPQSNSAATERESAQEPRGLRVAEAA